MFAGNGRSFHLTTLSAVTLLTLSVCSASATEFRSRCGEMSRVSVAVSNEEQFTISTTLTGVPGAVVSFVIPPTAPASNCVLVRFSGEAFVFGGPGVMLIRPQLDRRLPVPRDDIQFVVNGSNIADAHTYEFLFVDVPRGAHTVRMRFRSSNGHEMTLFNFIMVVQHR